MNKLTDLQAKQSQLQAELKLIEDQIEAAKKEKPKTNRQGLYLVEPEIGTEYFLPDVEPSKVIYIKWDGNRADIDFFKTCGAYSTQAAAEFENEKRRLLHDILAYCHTNDIEVETDYSRYTLFIGLYCIAFESEESSFKVYEQFKDRITAAQRDFVA
jgi:hypothetical protein